MFYRNKTVSRLFLFHLEHCLYSVSSMVPVLGDPCGPGDVQTHCVWLHYHRCSYHLCGVSQKVSPDLVKLREKKKFCTISTGTTNCRSVLFRLIVKYCDCGLAKWWGQQEFAIPQNVLEIVYGQTICWIGTFYCPMLPAICTIKYFFIFYIKKVIMQVTSVKITKGWIAFLSTLNNFQSLCWNCQMFLLIRCL